jgi:lipopolysaccharide export LptBFGC system permease protein LptF
VAFGLSLVVTLAWYLLLTFGQLFSQTGVLPVWLGPWIGTAVLGAVGIVLLVARSRRA